LPGRLLAVLTVAVAYLLMTAALSSERGPLAAGALLVLRPCIEGFLVAHVLYKWCRIRDFRSCVVVLGGFAALQFAAALAMALEPAWRAAFIESVYADESYQNPEFVGALLFRGYGISRHHLFGLPLALGLSAAMLMIVASLERPRLARWLMGASAIAALVVLTVNARIGFVPVLVCYIAGATIAFNRFHPRHAMAVALVVVLPVASFGAVWLGDDFEAVATWLAAGVDQFGGADSDDANTLSDLRSMLVFAPGALELLVGTGRACSTDESCYSDIGFIRALQGGGLILLALVVYLYTRLNRHIVRFFRATVGLGGVARRRAATLLGLVLHLTFFAAMVKGEAFGASDYSRLVAVLAGLGLLAAAEQRRRKRALARARPADPVLHPSIAS